MPDSLNTSSMGLDQPDFSYGVRLPIPDLCLHQSFEAWVDRSPDSPAIIGADDIVTFADLDKAANRLAQALLLLSLTPEEPVGVLVDRSATLPLAFLAILKAGGSYVPLLADLPAPRLASMATQAGIRLLIALDGHLPPPELLATLESNGRGRAVRVLAPTDTEDGNDQRPALLCRSEQLAAILFTSGSTGQPKGVQIQHDACQNMALGHALAQGIGADDRLLLSSSPGFILGFRELCLPLVLGCAWVPTTRALLDRPVDLVERMAQMRVSVALFTPSYLRLLGGAVPDGLRLILTAGERPNVADARHYARHVDYWNLHGATELCGTFAMHRVDPDGDGPLPSGHPFPNTNILILDDSGDPVPPGEEGEIFVVSPGASRGYLNQDALTVEAFVETRAGRAYRTHDLGRWTATGELLALGRLGDVVKVSGQAVALGEVEQAFLAQHVVRSATVVQHRGRLVGFVEAKPGMDLTGIDWTGRLSTSLPAYMIPALVMPLSTLPIASAGKVDRAALLALAEADWTQQLGTGGPPQGPVEAGIAAVWADVLGLETVDIGRTDDFFRLGGSSLLAIQAGQRLQAAGLQASVRDILGSLTVAALADLLTARTDERMDTADADPTPPATAGQVDFWVAASLGLPAAGSHIGRVLRLSGGIADAAPWRAAWTALLHHHPALRTGLFSDEGGIVRLRTLPSNDPALDMALGMVDFTTPDDASRFITAQTALAFDLTRPPLVRAGLMRVAGGDTLFWFVLHHALVDGMSANQIQQDLLSLLAGQTLPPALDAPRLASRTEQRHLASPLATHDREYWHSQLEALVQGTGTEAFDELPVDRRRVDGGEVIAAAPFRHDLDAATVERLTLLANRQGAGLHALLLALLAAEVRRRTGRQHLLLGSGIATRPAGTEDQIGHFVNLLPLSLTVPNDQTLAGAVRAAQKVLTAAVAHGLYPAGLIQRELRRQYPDLRPAGRLGLVDIALTANPSRDTRDPVSGCRLEPIALPGNGVLPPAGLDLSFAHEPVDGGGICLTLVWNAALFHPETAQQWLVSLAGWARWLAQDSARLDAPLPDLLSTEQDWLTRVERGADHPRPSAPAHRLVEAIVDRAPDCPAVITRTGIVTYGALEVQANRIAVALLTAGIKPEQPVGVLADNGPWLPAAALGIWKAGGVHLPLALEMPGERVAFILGDAGARHLLLLPGAEVPAGLPDGLVVIRPADLSGNVPRPDLYVPATATAYIIYTSGTTGAPKGTRVRHDGMINAILSTLDAVGRRDEDRVALVATPAFDASLWEMGLALLHGLPLVPVTRAEREDPWGLKDIYRDLGVTIAFHAPSYLRVSQDKPFPSCLRILLTGGEAPSHEDVAHYPGIEFWNCYGPTETSIIVSLGLIPPDHPRDRALHVGRPLPGDVISIRREDGSRVPPGATGEVWLGGVGVGGGYLNNPQQQEKAFVDTGEGRFYRSGDLGRWSADGLLELAGRIDHQVKLHGQRVEPAEIEQQLQAHPAVRQAVIVVDKGAGDTKLLRGFVHLKDEAKDLSNDAWRSFLADRLPPHMVPATIIAVPGIPVTANGKVDSRRLLAALHANALNQGAAAPRTPPSGPMEQWIADSWAALLGARADGRPLAREDNFFALGGTSLLAVAMAHRLAPQLGRAVSARDLFAAPVLSAFAARLQAAVPTPAFSARLVDDLATEGEREFWTAQEVGLDTSGHIVPTIRLVTGPMPDQPRWAAAWRTLVARQPALRQCFALDADGRLRRRQDRPGLLDRADGGLQWDEAADLETAIARIRIRQLAPFDMAQAPLWRVGITHVAADGTWLFWLSLHHSIGDGRSLGIVIAELLDLLQGRELAPLIGDPAGATRREQAYLAGPDLALDATWWAEQLDRVPASAFAPLPLDFPRTLGGAVATHRFQVVLAPEQADALRALARQHAVSLYALLVSLLAVEVGRRTGREHLVLGTTVTTPEDAGEAALVGYGVNMLPLCLRLDGTAPLSALFQAAQDSLAGGLLHARYPFARLYSDFWRRRPDLRDPLRFPLFDIAVTENPQAMPMGDKGLRLERLPADSSGYELTQSVHGQDMLLIHEGLANGAIALEWHVNAALFTHDSAAAWLDGVVERAVLLASRPDLPALSLSTLLDGAAPPPPMMQERVTASRTPARPGLEQDIAGLWADMLSIAPPEREDNFFALGGNSLLAISMAHRLSALLGRPVSARDLFGAPVLGDFAARLGNRPAVKVTFPGFDGGRATEGEREFWTAQKAGLDTSGHIMPFVRHVRGPMPPPSAWRTAWAALVARHPALRCRLREGDDGILYRDILDQIDHDLELAEAADMTQALAHIRTWQRQPLDLAKGPLWRVGLVQAADSGEWLFWLAQHHATGDGRSFGLLTGELLALLDGISLPELLATPETISAREQTYLAGDAAEDAAWWRNHLAALPSAAFDDWSLDLPRGTAKVGSHRHVARLDADDTQRLLAIARRHNASLHALVLTLLAHVVQRRTGRSDFLIGTTASLPETAAEAGIPHYGVNMLPLGFQGVNDGDFASLLRRTADGLSAALSRGRYPFARIYHDFWATHSGTRQPGRYPLFDIAITENPVSPRPVMTGLRLDRLLDLPADGIAYEATAYPPGQDMVLTHEMLVDGGLMLDWQMNASLYHADIARFWLEGVLETARWLAASGADTTLPALLPAEQAALSGWEQGPTVARPAMTFARWFETIVDRPGQAERPALLTTDGDVTYGELDRRASILAHRLIAAGVRPGQVVAVLTHRSAHLAVALLGVWKAGAVYLPLTADLPADRLSFMASDAGAVALLVLDGNAVPAGIDLPCIDATLDDGGVPAHRPDVTVQPDDLAYILYTSGSTGGPKGVMLAHAGYLNLVLGAVETYGLKASDRCLGFAAPSFDVSLSDIGIPLAAGAALCPVPADLVDQPAGVAALIRNRGITLADLTPTYLRLLDSDSLSGLRLLVTGGEAPLPADVVRLAGRNTYFNAYGPTESSITASMGCLSADRPDRLVCGRPLPNIGMEIRDPATGNRVAPGATGEIWLSGVGLACAYLNRPDLTEAAFVMTDEGRRYRTGDLGRWRGYGGLEVLGRIDQQVKLNGIRIELGEIEAAISRYPSVIQAVALVAGKAGERQSLWAFIHTHADGALPDAAGWRRFLGDILPPYMIPAALHPVDAIPITASGKIDRNALLARLGAEVTRMAGTPPLPGLEQTIADLWADLLSGGPVQREDDFFSLGGHSLLAITLCHRLERLLSCPIPARLLFADPVLSGFAARVEAFLAAPMPVIQAIPSEVATEGEREFWTAQQAGLETRGFTISLTLAVAGPIPDDAVWRRAWGTLVARHAALRTHYAMDADSDILRRVVAEISLGEFRIDQASDTPAALASIRNRQGPVFDMATGPLWRAGLVRVTDDRPLFWLALHHAVGDGASLGILLDDLSALLANRELPPLAATFADSAGRERAHLLGPAGRQDGNWWRERLCALVQRGEDSIADWPTDRPRPLMRAAGAGRGSHTLRLQLSPDQAQALRRLARGQGASLHALLLTLLGLEVRRRTGRTEFLLGTAASTRASAAEASVVGYYVTLLPLPFHLSDVGDTGTALAATRTILADALSHSAYPFARIARDFKRDHPSLTQAGRYPLFDMAVTENPALVQGPADDSTLRFAPADTRALPEPGIIAYDLRHNAPTQDMVLVHEGLADGGLSLSWFVNADLYDRRTAESWLTGLVGQALALLDQRIDRPLAPLLPAERALLAQWEQGEVLPPAAPSVAARFSRLAVLQPDRPALIADSITSSYAAVEARANGLAQMLRRQGVRAGQAVGVYTERSATLPVIALAIWKAGGCYVPLTHGLPGDRLRFMAADAGLGVLLILDDLAPPTELLTIGATILRIGEMSLDESGPLPLDGAPDRPAYILYTSGSTGTPKGVVLSQSGLVNLALGTSHMTKASVYDRALLIASPSFDLWISDLLMVWWAGGAIVPVTKAELDDPAEMKDKLRRLGVTMASMAPSYLRLFEQAEFPALRFLMTVGEAPVSADARFYAARLAYFNGYGPTETTAAATMGRIDPADDPVPAGRPLPNSFILILNARGERVPPGAVGDIWIGGASVGIGYLNRPDLTAQAFQDTPHGRLYRTGDQGRWRHDGQLVVLGRADGQVKLRGQRVELGEIEQALSRHPSVRQAAIIVAKATDGAQSLWGFIVPTDGAESSLPDMEGWKRFLGTALPAYMIPVGVMSLPTLPVNLAGKIDRKALLAVVADHQTNGGVPTGADGPRDTPRGPVEAAVAAAWAEILGRADLSRNEQFFDLGGDSLRAIAIIARLRRHYSVRINDLYENPVLADFAQACRPRADHLRDLIQAAGHHWRDYCDGLPAYEAARQADLAPAVRDYAQRNAAFAELDLNARADYRHMLLTGATGYLGSYLLRRLLTQSGNGDVTVLVRAADEAAARHRLAGTFSYYFGEVKATALLADPRLSVRAADLRRVDLGLGAGGFDRLAEGVDAILHAAANVSHVGHYHDFLADNVDATAHLIDLAERHCRSAGGTPADLHLVSTLSVCGRAPQDGFRLFSEYDAVPADLEENYYVRSKQEAERLVLRARDRLANASIHRVGNVVFAADGGPLQRNIKENAFSRLMGAVARLGVVPDDSYLWLCHVDVVADALVALAQTPALANLTHHIEHARRDTLADFITSAAGIGDRVIATDFGSFLNRVATAVEEPALEDALAEILEGFGLHRGLSPQSRGRRLELTSDRTQHFLRRLGVEWPALPRDGHSAMVAAALTLFTRA